MFYYPIKNCMEKKYKCESCGSESTGTAGTCCGMERKAEGSKAEGMEHNHKEGEVCPVCGTE